MTSLPPNDSKGDRKELVDSSTYDAPVQTPNGSSNSVRYEVKFYGKGLPLKKESKQERLLREAIQATCREPIISLRTKIERIYNTWRANQSGFSFDLCLFTLYACSVYLNKHSKDNINDLIHTRKKLLPIVRELTTGINKIDAHSAANLIWSLGLLSIDYQNIIIPIKKIIKNSTKEYNFHSCSRILWALASISDSDSEIFKLIVEQALRDASTKHYINTEDAINILWATGISHPELFKSLWKALENKIDFNACDSDSLRNLYYVLLVNGIDKVSIYEKLKNYSKSSEANIYYLVKRACSNHALELLNGLSIKCLIVKKPLITRVVSRTLNIRGLCTGVSCVAGKCHIIVEFHTPADYVAFRTKGKLSGEAVLREKVFKHCGFNVVHLSAKEWQQNEFKVALLRGKIKKIVDDFYEEEIKESR